MPSKALDNFLTNMQEVDDLLRLHRLAGGPLPGRRSGLEALNKSDVVLICAIWEAYCEDLCLEALDSVLGNVTSSDRLPKELRKLVASTLKTDKNEIAVWGLADKGWQLECRRIALQAVVAPLNTPKTANIQEVFERLLGLRRLAASWTWRRMPATQAGALLDAYVSLRGDIAHRLHPGGPVRKTKVTGFIRHVGFIIGATDPIVANHVASLTGRRPW
jgi:hypothetical protein